MNISLTCAEPCRITIPKLNPSLFEWTIWRNGSPIDIFGVALRQNNIPVIKAKALQYAIGYCEGTSLLVRPKSGTRAVMFFKDGVYYWWHFYIDEFDAIFQT